MNVFILLFIIAGIIVYIIAKLNRINKKNREYKRKERIFYNKRKVVNSIAKIT